MLGTGEINLDILMNEIGIDMNSVIELLNLYCMEMTEEMQQVRMQMKAQDWAAVQRTVHNIKGVSANLFLQDMFAASEAVDLRLKGNDCIGIDHSIQNMFDVFENTQHSIKKALQLYAENA